MKILYIISDRLLLITHLGIVLFILTGWIWKKTRKIHIVIVFITASILLKAITNPSKICARSLALLSSYFVLRLITSSRCLIYSSSTILSVSTFGWIPSIKANIFTWKVSCNCVFLYNAFKIFLG